MACLTSCNNVVDLDIKNYKKKNITIIFDPPYFKISVCQYVIFFIYNVDWEDDVVLA